MKLKRNRRGPQSETIIALIDVVFFLLVFFMLVGRMDASAPFEVLPAAAQTGSDMPAGGATVSVSATGVIAVDGATLSQNKALLNLSDQLADNPQLLIRVNAHRDAILQDLLPLIGKIEGLGARDIVLVVTPEADP